MKKYEDCIGVLLEYLLENGTFTLQDLSEGCDKEACFQQQKFSEK